MIPKIIHYCWFGGAPLSQKSQKCIESWKRFLPDYQIIRWDETNFDVNAISYTREAYTAGKYAFVSDYARFWIVYNFGGVYFDTDVEVVKPLNDILARGPYLGVEYRDDEHIDVNPGLGFAAPAKFAVIGDLMMQYHNFHFINERGEMSLKNIVHITTEYLLSQGLANTPEIQRCCGVTIYPVDYFCPISYESRKLALTNNTRSIHHFAESWVPKSTKIKNAIGRVLGLELMGFLVAVKRLLRSKEKNDNKSIHHPPYLSQIPSGSLCLLSSTLHSSAEIAKGRGMISQE